MKTVFSEMTKRILLLTLPVLALMLTDCHCQKNRIVVKSVLLEMPTTVSGFAKKLDREKFSDLVTTVLDNDANFIFDQQREDGELLRLNLVLPTELTANSKLLLAASLDKSAEAGVVSTKAFADIAVEDGRISGTNVSETVARVLQNLYHLRFGKLTNSDEYIKKLEQAVKGEVLGPGELINAITVLAEMHEKKAEPMLIALLDATNSISVGNACLVALGELGSKDGMNAIINFAERKPPVLRRQAIIAAQKIASLEAAQWLVVMAYGYEDPIVRAEAMAALVVVEEKLGLPDAP